MSPMSRLCSLAVVALVAIGCGSSSPSRSPQAPSGPTTAAPADAAVAPRPALADDLPALALRARQMFLDWRAALSDASADCPTATAKMNALADTHAEVIEANQQVMRDGHEKRKALRAEIANYEEELAPVEKAIAESPIMERCSSDPTFMKAIDRLQGDR
jgi:hypothetical protein